VNERYLPQLSTILSFPQSVGIVGGRPGASLYFVGVQGGAVLYLDPHEAQEVSTWPTVPLEQQPAPLRPCGVGGRCTRSVTGQHASSTPVLRGAAGSHAQVWPVDAVSFVCVAGAFVAA
jgi:hypothetical protein